jgi:raffinose/stachyose/melibiose transport system substrate-binding protein
MMKFKKVSAIILSVLLSLSVLTACGSKADGNKSANNTGTSNTQNSNESVTLTVWGDTDNQAILETSFKQVNEAFEKKYPNIKLDYQYSGSFDTINVALQSNSLPDLFWVQGNKSTKMAEMAKNGFLLPLDKYNFDKSRFPEQSVEYASVDGSIYCSFPSFFDYAVIYYNKDIFEKYGLDKPKNWAEFENILKTLKDKGEVPMAFGGKGDFVRYWLTQIMAPALANDVLAAIKEHKTDVDYTNMIEMFDAYRGFAEKGYLGKDFASTDGAGAQLAFTNGKAAMIVDGTWNNQIFKDTSLNIGRFALPGKDGKRYSQSGPSNYNTYAVSSKTKHPDEAAKYIEFLNSAESQQIFENNLGAIPLVKDIAPKDDSVKELAEYDVVGNNIYHVLSGVADDKAKPQDKFLGDVLPKLMTSKITGTEAVQIIKDEIAKSSAK